jgi:putative aldouronate transport system substrate-binding protein
MLLKRENKLLLAVMVVGLLSACGGKPKNAALGAGGSAIPVEAGSDRDYFDSTGNMILPLVEEPVTFKVLWNKDPQDKGTIKDKSILEKAFNDTGLRWNVEEVSSAGWTEKVSVVFASNDLPDLFTGGIPNLVNFTDQCVDITDMLPKYMPFTADFLMNRYPSVTRAEAFSGRLYSLPGVRINNVYPSLGLWHINTTWLKNVGMGIPQTTDELYAVLKAFKEKDANGNGDLNDEIPFSFVKLLDDIGLLPIMNCFGLINDGANKAQHYIMVENNRVFFAPIDRRFYDMLEYLNKLYVEGLLDKDGFVQSRNDRYAKASANKVGFAIGGGLITETFGNEVGEQISYMLPPKSKYGAVIKQNDPPGELSLHLYTITKKCKSPELLLLLAEYSNATPDRRFETRFGPEGGAWEVGASGKFINATNYQGKPYDNRAQAVATLSPYNRLPYIITWEDESRREYLGLSETYNKAIVELYGPDGGAAYNECFPLGNDTLESIQNRSELFTEIDIYIQNFIVNSVINGITETKWKEHQDMCRKLNIEAFISDYQGFYDRVKALGER